MAWRGWVDNQDCWLCSASSVAVALNCSTQSRVSKLSRSLGNRSFLGSVYCYTGLVVLLVYLTSLFCLPPGYSHQALFTVASVYCITPIQLIVCNCTVVSSLLSAKSKSHAVVYKHNDTTTSLREQPPVVICITIRNEE